MKNALLIDYIQVQPDQKLISMDKADKFRLLDSVEPGKKGLSVTLPISHSVRRINNRIYSPVGQKNGVNSLTTPYRKPLLRNHDRESDPLGRFTNGKYVDTSNDAMASFKTMQDFANLQSGFKDRDWEKLAKTLHKMPFLADSKWEGFGRLEGTVLVSDQDAIEKFLDGRYLTFSGGANTNHLVCSHCFSDWMKGDFCDHVPGQIVDGKVVLHLTDRYEVAETSVVTIPADNLSQVSSIQWTDADGERAPKLTIDDSTIYLTDSLMILNNRDIKDMSVREVLEIEENRQALMDNLAGETLIEGQLLKSLHDGLHAQYDWQLRYDEKAAESTPKDIFKLHAKLHETAMAKGWRDSLMNGHLDHYSADAEETHEFVYPDRLKKMEEEMKEYRDSMEAKLGQLLDQVAKLQPKEIVNVVDGTEAQAPEATKEDASASQTEAPAETQEVKSTVELEEFESLQQDYKQALLQVDEIKKQLFEVLDFMASMNEKTFGELADSEKSTVMYDWFVSLRDSKVEKPVETPPVLENPSVSGTSVAVVTDSSKSQDLDGYQKFVVSRYRELQKTSVRDAESYIAKLKYKGLIPANFIPSSFS